MTASQEAAQLLATVVSDLSAPNPDLRKALRMCLHACQIMGWAEEVKWFEQELGGYFPTTDLPPHRRLKARLVWQSVDFPTLTANTFMAGAPGYKEIKALPVEIIEQEVRANIDWILKAASVGYMERTGETSSIHVGGGKGFSLAIERIKYLDTYVIEEARITIEHFTFEFASRRYAQLAYGEALTDVWQGYKRDVDAALAKMNLGDHLASIQTGLQSALEPDHRKAVLGCRSLLEDVARHLWRDPRDTYTLLPGGGEGNTLQVTDDKPSNRLSAYLHQKGITGKQGKFFRDELDRLATSIRNLIAVQGEAHSAVTLQDARLVALATHLLIGALAMYTDLEPIPEYPDPKSAEP